MPTVPSATPPPTWVGVLTGEGRGCCADRVVHHVGLYRTKVDYDGLIDHWSGEWSGGAAHFPDTGVGPAQPSPTRHTSLLAPSSPVRFPINVRERGVQQMT